MGCQRVGLLWIIDILTFSKTYEFNKGIHETGSDMFRLKRKEESQIGMASHHITVYSELRNFSCEMTIFQLSKAKRFDNLGWPFMRRSRSSTSFHGLSCSGNVSR